MAFQEDINQVPSNKIYGTHHKIHGMSASEAREFAINRIVQEDLPKVGKRLQEAQKRHATNFVDRQLGDGKSSEPGNKGFGI